MPVAYDRIRTAAWTASGPDTSVVARYRTLPFPEHWRETVLELCNVGRSEDSEPYRTVPTWRMEQVLQAMVPDCLVLPRASQENGPGHWLCLPEGVSPLPEAAFRILRNGWLGDLRPEREHRAALQQARAALDADPPVWREAEFELLRCPVTIGGTAAPLDHQFALTTDWLARQVLALPPYDFGGGALRFRAVPRGSNNKGAELVSQALPFEDGKRTWWYSITLNITLHTVPFSPFPRLHLHCGIRRWATRTTTKTGRLHLPYRRRTTVLLRPRVPWLPGAPGSERFAVARLERRWNKEEQKAETGWAGGGPAGMLRGISLADPFPDADAVLSDPERWIADGMRAAVVHSTAMGAHGVGAGLMSDQRSKIVDWAAQAVPAELWRVPDRSRTLLGPPTPANASGTPKKADQPAAELRRATDVRTAAVFAVSALESGKPPETPVLEARLLWQTPQMRDIAVDALVSYFGLKDEAERPGSDAYQAAEPGAPAVLEWQSPELTVRLRCLKLTGGLGEDLDLPQGGRPGKAALVAALTDRRDRAAAFLTEDAPGPVPSLTLVELDRRADFASPDHDPKFALRVGFARAGVLSQFMTVPKKVKGHNSLGNAEHRALKAWDDGLRQLGARVHPEPNVTEGLPEGLRHAAIWLVRKNRTARARWAAHAPVAVLVTPERPGSGIARVQGWDAEADDGAGAWIPYPAMLLRLAQRADIAAAAPDEEEGSAGRPGRKRSMDEQRKATERWLQQVQRSLRGVPTLLLVHAQNARSHWTWVQDGTVEIDRIRTGHAPSRRLDPDLRLLRVRTGEGRETVQWWGVHPKEGANGIPSHLWTSATDEQPRRIFWSTTAKPVQFRSSAVQADKLAGRPMTLGPRAGELTVDTDKPAWNPTLVELAVLGCHEDDGDVPEALALAVHQMRQPPDYPEALLLPLPLHLAKHAQEYVLPLGAEETAQE